MNVFALAAIFGLAGVVTAFDEDVALAQSEVYIPQAKGRLSHSALPPLRRAPVASHGSRSIGMYPGGIPRYTCTWVNATSPHCHAATQQGRAVPR
jgi:hypothetical protein